MARHPLSEYIELARLFLKDKISAIEFERRYLRMFKEDPAIRPDGEYQILNRLFSDVDSFCADPALRTVNDLDEGQLRFHVSNAISALNAISTANQG